ncbi:MAG: DUF362 domain-containing protein [Nitrospirota bacterium]|nr:DUF362 domain-containing protein [Nitrospirota bacterium]
MGRAEQDTGCIRVRILLKIPAVTDPGISGRGESVLKVMLRRAEYECSTLKPLIFELLDGLAGDRIGKAGRVLIKPNLLAPATPDKAMLTHPLIVRAAAEYVLRKGGIPLIADSPAMGTFDRVMKESGIREALKGLDVECREFKRSVAIDVGPPFNRIEIAEDVMRADVVLNLPKLKTHTQMLLTLGVKNLFGCIVGLRKPEWHFRTGVDREMFARLLVRICRAIGPSVTLLDGILAMEGQGPGKSGLPRRLGLLLAGTDPVAVDMTVCRMLGLDPMSLLTNRMAAETGTAPPDIRVDGELQVIENFLLPEITPLVFGPKSLHGFMRRHLVQRPLCDDALCRLCGECWKYCPAGAIKAVNKKVRFDYDACIRCYCCIEVCPHGALRAAETVYGKVARKLLKRHED